MTDRVLGGRKASGIGRVWFWGLPGEGQSNEHTDDQRRACDADLSH